ncbi:MAG: peptidyl-prolyl cis-trans isomerase [Bacteroidetes bacterium]|nr:peptidyl-prolyl cis-trans isomerase [Bacteroidota bacterium]
MRKIQIISFFLSLTFFAPAQSNAIDAKAVAKAQIEKYRERVIKGEKMEDLARAYSEDKASALKGGLILNVKKGQMDPEFEKVAFSLKQGQVSEVFETVYGYHFIQLVRKHGELVDVRHLLIIPN